MTKHCKTKGFRQLRTDLGKFPTECATARCTFPFVFVNGYTAALQLDCSFLEAVRMSWPYTTWGISQSLCFVLLVLRQVCSISLEAQATKIGKFSKNALKLRN